MSKCLGQQGGGSGTRGALAGKEALPILAEVHSCSDNVASHTGHIRVVTLGKLETGACSIIVGSYVSLDLNHVL